MFPHCNPSVSTTMLEYLAFLSCLEFAVLNSMYENRILKPKQVLCMETLYRNKDVVCVLPTGYGKSLIFHLLPMLLFVKYNLGSDVFQISRQAWRSSKEFSADRVNSIVIVVSPLNALMNDQVARLSQSNSIEASVIDARELKKDENMDAADVFNGDIDYRLCEKKKLRDGQYQTVFAHPEGLISSKYGRELLLSQTYSENVVAIVVDEAHCIMEWLV